ncbi:MAG: SPOR domain-containing protein [Bacteroidales bacterium]|nr:SPOR domain-containing protein [Bacteroidales bacterium]
MLKFTQHLLLSLLFTLFCNLSYSQVYNDFGEETEYDIYKLPSLDVNFGFLSFFGDVDDFNGNIPFVGKQSFTLGVQLQQRIGKIFGISVDGIKGQLSGFDTRPGSYYNFQSDLLQGNFNVFIHLDNDIIIRKSSRFSPYLKIGIGYAMFEPMGDLFDKNGKKYHYWRDGTIRDQEFDAENPQNGNHIERDYVFETKLDSLNSFDKSAIIVPVGGGIKYKLSDFIESHLSLTYMFTNTNYIDNLAFENKSYPLFDRKNDNYLYSSVSLQFNIGGIYKKILMNKPYRDINFAEIDAMDHDRDAIPDQSDFCPDTPNGVRVDATGCPLDDDADGVPNYLDKELSTVPGSLVDEQGVTITAEMIEAKFIRDSLIMSGELILHQTISTGTPIITEDYQAGADGTVYSHVTYPYVPANWPDDVSYIQVNTSGSRSRTKTRTNTSTTNNNRTVPTAVVLTNESTGTFFRVQIGASQRPLEENFFKNRFNINEEVRVEQNEGWYRYTIGNFPSYQAARNYARQQSNIEGAFVVKYENGIRVLPSSAANADNTPVNNNTSTTSDATTTFNQRIDGHGVFFRVQIGASPSRLSEGFFKQNFAINDYVYEEQNEGQYKYTIGHFTNYNEARSYASRITSVQGAFVTAYRDGVRIALQDAVRTLE